MHCITGLRHIPRYLFLLLAVLLFATAPADAGSIGSRLQQELAQAASDDPVRVIVHFTDQVNLTPYAQRKDRKQARRELVQDLRGRANRAQGSLQKHLRQQKHPFKELWLINAVAVELPASQVAALAAWPGVESIETEGTTAPPVPLPQAAAVVADDWNLTAIGAQTLWAQGVTGNGVVVAVFDTGVNPNHLELANKFRDLPGDWFNPYALPGTAAATTPYDTVSPATGLTHGTAVTSVILGSTVGVAPGAQWIAAKIFPDSGSALNSYITAAFQWALAPGGNPDNAPDIVNNSWGFEDSRNQCLNTFQSEIDALQSVGIHVVFAAGNLGPDPRTSISPGNNSKGFAVGSVGADMSVSNLSSRGPSPCATSIYTPLGATDVFPELVTPGDGVLVANGTTNSYAFAAGTSLATPHLSGALALLREAVPIGAEEPPVYRSHLEFALLDSAADIDLPGPDNNAGYGLLDIPAAFYRLDDQPSLAVYTPGAPENDDVVDFGNVPQNTGSTLALRLDNVGGANLNLSFVLTDLLPPFTLVSNNCPATLAADATCVLNLSFTPTVSGPFSRQLQINSNDPRQPNLAIALQGTCNTAPPVAILTAPVDGATGQPRTSGVVFHWYQGEDPDGDQLTMTLTIADNKIFFGPLFEFVLQFTQSGGLVLAVGLLPCFYRRTGRRALAWLAVTASLAGLTAFAGCGGAGETSSVSANATYTVNGLAPNTTYYWKVVTTDNNGNPVESDIHSFTTGS